MGMMDHGAHGGNGRVPRCSVVIPAYNTGPWVAQALDSLDAQPGPPWECLVVDDGSTDDTAAVVKNWMAAHPERPVRLIRQANAGVSSARNRGVAEAQRPVLYFLDSDDVVLPGGLQRLYQALMENPSAAAAYGEGVVLDEQGRVAGSGKPAVFNPRPSGHVLPALAKRNFILTGAICVRRDAFLETGGFDISLQVGEDWACWCRLAANAPMVYVGGEPVMGYRIRENSAIRLQKNDLAPALMSVDNVFADPAVQAALGEQFTRIERAARASAYEFSANEPLRQREWRQARARLWQCLRRDPLRRRAWILWCLARLHWLPPFIEKHLK